MTQEEVQRENAAAIEGLKHLQNTLRGLRLSPDTALAGWAVNEERSVEQRLKTLRATMQPELRLAEHHQAA